MASQGYEEDLLRHWFPTTEEQTGRKSFAEKDIREISSILERADKVCWSKIPRIYIVLRLIGQLDTIGSFVQEEISDTWFPFTPRSLPKGLREHSDRSCFLDQQRLVCNTKALNLERPDAGHGHFPDASEVPLKKVGELGKGGSGFVDRVVSTITHREYALKSIKRGQTFRKDKEVLRDFERELSNLKRLSRAHKHIIDLIGSYTEPRYVCILFPVADYNLSEFLAQTELHERRWSLRSYFGCLASALGFLHANKIRHKDIKPQNILIKDDEPYFTDFGVSVDWAEYGHSTTFGPTAMTPRYGAPEVAASEPRNSSSDIWSLGCVFLELWTALKGETAKELTNFFTADGRLLPYHSKDADVSAWKDRIEKLPGSNSDNLPSVWIEQMLKRERGDRWSAYLLLESIRESSEDLSAQYLYIGRCCLDDEETGESVTSDTSEEAQNVTIEASTTNTDRPPPRMASNPKDPMSPHVDDSTDSGDASPIPQGRPRTHTVKHRTANLEIPGILKDNVDSGPNVPGKKTSRMHNGRKSMKNGQSSANASGIRTPSYSNAASEAAEYLPIPSNINIGKLDTIASKFRTEFVPTAIQFMNNPPEQGAKRDYEYNKLSETILTQIIFKLDDVETEGDQEARLKRKALVKEVQGTLNKLDEVMSTIRLPNQRAAESGINTIDGPEMKPMESTDEEEEYFTEDDGAYPSMEPPVQEQNKTRIYYRPSTSAYSSSERSGVLYDPENRWTEIEQHLVNATTLIRLGYRFAVLANTNNCFHIYKYLSNVRISLPTGKMREMLSLHRTKSRD
jgi:serine/threonine protein kinase